METGVPHSGSQLSQHQLNQRKFVLLLNYSNAALDKLLDIQIIIEQAIPLPMTNDMVLWPWDANPRGVVPPTGEPTRAWQKHQKHNDYYLEVHLSSLPSDLHEQPTGHQPSGRQEWRN
jgi:hypothetical protein